jgi:VWFA-related protein
MLARLSLLLLLSGFASQTDTPQKPPVFRTEVNLVEVDVHVLDRDGKFVGDLRLTDFEVFEDGVPQTVATFRLVDLPMPSQPFAEPGAAPALSDVVTNEGAAEGLVYALVLGDLHTAPERTTRTRQIARHFVEKWLGDGDLAAVTTTSGTLDASSDFTGNRQALLEAIDTFNGRRLPSPTSEVIELRDALLNEMLKPQSLRAQLRSLDDQHAFRATTALSHLRSMSDILGDIEGRRKVILYIGEGIPYHIDMIKAESVGTAALLDIRRAVASTGRSNVSIYSLDVRGLSAGQEDLILVSPSHPPGALYTYGLSFDLDPRLKELLDKAENPSQAFAEEVRRSRDSLRLLADETGGLAAVNRNDLDQGLRELVTDNRRFYKLGYYPPNVKADGRFREIEVRLKRRDLNVRARKGYIVPEEEGKPAEFAEADGLDPRLRRDILNRPSPITDLPLRVLAFPFRFGEETCSVAVVVECDTHPFRFTEEDGRFLDRVTVSAVVLDEKGAWVTGKVSKFDLALRPSARELMRHDGFRALSVFDAPPGSYQLRVGVWEDGAGQKGSVYYDLVLPSTAESELVMGGILLSSRLERAVPVASTPEARQAVPFLPSTRRKFMPRDQILTYVQMFQDRASTKADDIVVVTVVRDANGTTVFESRERSALPTNTPLVVTNQIDLSDLSPGPYIIEVQARDPDGVVDTRKRNFFHVIGSPSMADLPLSANYMDLLTSYRRGHFDEARNQLATWTDDRVKNLVDELRSSDADPRTWQAAVLLHTELSAYNAWGLSAETRALHLQAAETFVARIPGEKAFNRDWLLTVACIYHGSNLAVSRHYLEVAGERFPDDAEILLATGVTYEISAAGMPRSLSTAEKFYRRAIHADSDLAEAHLRLGKVLQERGGNRREEAMRELGWVVDNASDPYMLYLANLFLGDLHKSKDDFVTAADFYRSAVESEPRWQIAHIALSQALHASGDRFEARNVMQKALRLPGHDPSYVDGYRLYALGQLTKVPQMLAELRQGITE